MSSASRRGFDQGQTPLLFQRWIKLWINGDFAVYEIGAPRERPPAASGLAAP
jgi:hypothetical protein